MNANSNYTVYDREDSSSYDDGLTREEAIALCAEKNAGSRYGDRFSAVEDAVFAHFFLLPAAIVTKLRALQPGVDDDDNGVDEILKLTEGPYVLPGVLPPG